MKQGDIVTLRLEETGKSRIFVLGLIVDVENKGNRLFYHVLARDSIHVVTNSDLGPPDISLAQLKNTQT